MNRRVIVIAASVATVALAVGLALNWTLGSDTAVPETTGSGAPSTSKFYPAGPFKVQVLIDPKTPKVGKNRVTVLVEDGAGQPVSGAALKVVAVMPGMGSMPAMYAPAEMTETATGRYEGEFAPAMGGEWPLTIEIETAAGAGSLTFDLATGRKGIRCATCADDVRSAGTSSAAGTVRVDPARRQLIGITTGRAERRSLRYTIRAPGVVTYDQTRLSDVALKYDGWIGKLDADYAGKPVAKGARLFTVYSPDLLAAQEQYLETRRRAKTKGGKTERMLDAARRRLRLWDLTPAQITKLERRGRAEEYVSVLAPTGGVVVDKDIVAGSAFRAGQRLLRVADLSRVWVEGQVYDHELALISVGMKAEVVLPDLQGRELQGEVSFIYPYMEGDTRTTRVRVVLDNADGLLRPNMYAQINLDAHLGKRLVVPEAAVLYAGRSRVVFLDLGDGRLQPRTIKTGLRTRDWIEVREGVDEGDLVVTSGNFLIASESKLKAGLEQW